MSTLGVFSALGEISSVHWRDTISALGVHRGCIGGIPSVHWGDIMKALKSVSSVHLGDIISVLGVHHKCIRGIQCIEAYDKCIRGYHDLCGAIIHALRVFHNNTIFPNALMHS